MSFVRRFPSLMWLTLGATVVALALAFAPGGASIASATPVADDCSGVPDQGPNFNFHSACQIHDNCYATFSTPIRTAISEANRAACDNAFFVNMKAWCSQALLDHVITAAGASACKTRASVYYQGVRLFGGLFFYNSNPV